MVIVAIVAIVAQCARAQTKVTAESVATAIRLDGKLDETFWKTTVAVELVQQSPTPQGDTHYRTFVRVAVNQQSIYFGFECVDPSPEKLAIHTMARDGEFDGDDSVAIVLDTYRDRRTGYYFRVNAAAARLDGLISGFSEPGLEWDGLWDARVSRSATGWTAEVEIPSRTISFSEGNVEWGVNFERYIPRDRTTLRWMSATLDAQLFDMSRAGSMILSQALKRGLGLEISPYATTRANTQFSRQDRTMTGSLGADLTYRLLPQFSVMVTTNTDFAEAEVDARQLNLTRFSLYYPERRSFFLEGSEHFQFGFGLEDLFIPFFSRRIGLVEGETVPLDWGVRAGGRLGRWNLGVVGVRTGETVLSSGQIVKPAESLASRISYDATPSLRVGAIATTGDPQSTGQGALAGLDGLWRTSSFLGSKNLLIGGWTALAGGDGKTGERHGYGWKVDYPNDRWSCSLSRHHFGQFLEPGVGFLPRPGVQREDAACDFRPRPSKSGPLRAIRQSFIENRFDRTTNLRGQMESQHYEFSPYNVEFESGDRIDFSWSHATEYLPERFEIASDVMLPVGTYRFQRVRMEVESSRHRQNGGGATAMRGGFYSGTLAQYLGYARYTGKNGGWELNMEGEWNRGHFPEGLLSQRLIRFRGVFAFSPNAEVTSVVQYDSDSGETANNLRMRWIFRPGKELIVVWNRGWRHWQDELAQRRITPESEALVMKIRWTWRP